MGAVGWVVWGVSESRVTFGRHGADSALYFALHVWGGYIIAGLVQMLILAIFAFTLLIVSFAVQKLLILIRSRLFKLFFTHYSRR